mgnify:CR=1 FL=1
MIVVNDFFFRVDLSENAHPAEKAEEIGNGWQNW